MTDFAKLFASMTRAFKSLPADQLADMEDIVNKAGTTDEPRSWHGVGASGGGAERTISQSSPDSDHGDALTKLYDALGDMNRRQAATEKAQKEQANALLQLGSTVSLMLGKGGKLGSDEDEADSDEGNKPEVTTPNWDASGAKEKTGKDDELERAEKATISSTSTNKSLSSIFDDLHKAAMGASKSTGRVGLVSPPDMSRLAVAKARNSGPTDEEIASMSPADAVEALMERQRDFHRQRLGLI